MRIFHPRTFSLSLNLNLCPINVMYGAGDTGRRFEIPTPGDLLRIKVKENPDNKRYSTQGVVEKTQRDSVEEELADQDQVQVVQLIRRFPEAGVALLVGSSGSSRPAAPPSCQDKERKV